MGEKVFIEKYNEEIDKRPRDPKTPEQEDLYNKEREKELNPKVLEAVSRIYLATQDFAKVFHEKHQHILYFTPVFFLRTFRTFTNLLQERKDNVVEVRKRYDKGLEKLKETMSEVQYYSDKLKKKTPSLQVKQRKLIEAIVDIEEEYQKISISRERLKADENNCEANL